jgi:hypothetical protein
MSERPQVKIAQPSIMSLFVQMRFRGQPLGTGTCFLVNAKSGPALITNRHIVTGRHQDTEQPLSSTGGIPDELMIVQNRQNQPGTWFSVVEPLYLGSSPRWVEHPQLGARADFVALPLINVTDVGVYPYDPAAPGIDLALAPAEVVSVIGFPFGLAVGGAAAIWATGFVATEPEVEYNGLPVFLIDCRGRPGQSGSAVIAYRNGGMVALRDGGAAAYNGPVWRFLGIYSGRVNLESDLGFVWKATAIAELIRSM